MAPDALIAEMQTTALDRRFDIVLKPISHPELGDIRIANDLFAVGRTEMPFASWRPEIVAELSRRHARIFFEHGAAYIADLGSKNGTTVNGVDIREKARPLHSGDEIRFAGVLAYRVEFVSPATQPTAQAVTVTLTPERADLGLQPLVITGFPFLISKADDTFARYKSAYPHQVNYVSRRHAHIFLRNGEVFVEDLGSTNGTFVGGTRLDESAMPLEDGGLLAFGGNHFVYRAGVQRGRVADPTVTKMQTTDDSTAESAADADRTTFVAAAHSFLDIFCVDPALQREDEVNLEAPQRAEDPTHEVQKRRQRSSFDIFVSELSEAFGGSGQLDVKRLGWWGGAALAALCVLFAVLHFVGTPQQDMKALLAGSRYATAAQVADQYLARHPDDAVFQAAGVEALMKSKLPDWLAAMRAHRFDRARAIVGEMKALARHNAAAQPLVAEIAWIGDLEAFVMGRGGPDAPIRIYQDEPVIKTLIDHWNDDPNEHQRALDRISSYVPEFRDSYADALSHLRKLQSDDSVYVAAIGRLKTAIDTALNDDRFDALPATLDDYGERYPRLSGLDSVRDDLRQYTQLESEARAGHTQAMAERLKHVRFATPPFRARIAKLEKLATTGGASEARPSP
jgi:pSer/pThr/pTyr-binding forkhead associated (FHA) protein